ncbi:MAG: hypothetical protein LBK42_12090 [Propionibacteriaceae bacterium]|jgi:hypothetical protein|nr:hypothetical protein [Propionibacteriaceae bacterium]
MTGWGDTTDRLSATAGAALGATNACHRAVERVRAVRDSLDDGRATAKDALAGIREARHFMTEALDEVVWALKWLELAECALPVGGGDTAEADPSAPVSSECAA